MINQKVSGKCSGEKKISEKFPDDDIVFSENDEHDNRDPLLSEDDIYFSERFENDGRKPLLSDDDDNFDKIRVTTCIGGSGKKKWLKVKVIFHM